VARPRIFSLCPRNSCDTCGTPRRAGRLLQLCPHLFRENHAVVCDLDGHQDLTDEGGVALGELGHGGLWNEIDGHVVPPG
jgi:hypothetical protein